MFAILLKYGRWGNGEGIHRLVSATSTAHKNNDHALHSQTYFSKRCFVVVRELKVRHGEQEGGFGDVCLQEKRGGGGVTELLVRSVCVYQEVIGSHLSGLQQHCRQG